MKNLKSDLWKRGKPLNPNGDIFLMKIKVRHKFQKKSSNVFMLFLSPPGASSLSLSRAGCYFPVGWGPVISV
jgi:hypothetical protein